MDSATINNMMGSISSLSWSLYIGCSILKRTARWKGLPLSFPWVASKDPDSKTENVRCEDIWNKEQKPYVLLVALPFLAM